MINKKYLTSTRNENYAVAYCRYSSMKQGEGSIEAQKYELNRYAEQNGIKIMDWYIDRAKSAKDDKRPNFLQMIKDCKENNYKYVLVHKLDRLSRNTLLFLKYEQELNEMGVEIIYTAQPNMNNKTVKLLFASMAEEYIDNLAAETTKGMVVNARNGKRNGGNVPYGYTLEKEIDELGNPKMTKNGNYKQYAKVEPEQAEAVKIMFQMTIDGYTREDIIKVLTEKGFTKVSKKNFGKPFTGTAIDNILRNERYTGEYDYYYNKGTRTKPEYDTIRVTNEFPAIISKDTFFTVQKLLQARVHRPPCNAEENYLLTGKVICGHCGGQYNGMRCKRHGKMYKYYKCVNQSSYKNGQTQREYCHNNSVDKELLEEFVLEELKRVVFNEKFIPQVYEQYNNYAKSQKVDKSMIEILEKKIEKIDSNIDNIISSIEQGFSSESLKDRLTTLEIEKKQTEEKLREEKSGDDYIPATISDVAKIYFKAQQTLNGNDLKAKRRLVQNFVNKIVVYKDKVEVYINLIPTTCCATLDLDILKTHLFSGELKYGDWDLQGTESAKNLLEYRKLCQKKDAKFKANNELITQVNEKTGEIVDIDSIFTIDNQQGQPDINQGKP